ncbi:MAG: M1 family metallopeptidase, partial [Candidatus Kariarchaeaceae archaeon]
MDDFANIEPVHYKLSYEPNLETFIFQGRMEFDFTLLAPSSSIKLHALDITVRQLHRSENGQMIELSHTTDLSNQLMTIEFDRELSGNVKLIAEFTGEHNDKLAGWYRGKFRDVQGMEHYCVVSQFQANDARRAFPCVDIPGKKATFDIDFLVDKDLMAISNMPIDRQEEENGKKRVYFGRTPTMSTYLLFYGVGDFEAIEKTSNGTLYRTIAHPPKAVNNGQFSLDFGVEVVEYMEEYFDFDYPLPKLDQIATPAFAAGAMENWGAILYRENALLYYDGITSETQTNGILGVIAHEIAHQWFGNLVSPTTWKYLWLNESFATFFASHVVDALRPERRVFENYVYSTNLARGARSTSGVMDWDTMIATSPIELDGDGEIS